MKKHFKSIVSLVLIMAITVSLIVPASAKRDKNYVSEMKISYAEDGEKAKKTLEDQGFTVVEKDLNANTRNIVLDSGESMVYLGYKTTTDPKKAITDMAMMSEQNGYSLSDFETIMNSQYSQYLTLAEKEMDLIKEFRVKYKSNSAFAISSHKYLNNFKEDDSGKLLGDFFLDENLSEKDVFKLVTQITPYALGMFNQLLTTAITEQEKDSFFNKLSALSEQAIASAKNDNSLHSAAMIFYDQLVPLKQQLTIGKNIVDIVAKMKPEDIAAKEKDEEWQELLIENAYGICLVGILETVKYNGGNLYDLLMKENLAITELYPIVEVMTKGQISAVAFVGLTPFFITSVGVSEEERLEQEKAFEESYPQEKKTISAYYGVDRAAFTEKVGVTSAATREMNATNNKAPLCGNYNSAIAITTGVFAGVSGATFITATCFFVKYSMLRTQLAASYEGIVASFTSGGQQGAELVAQHFANLTDTYQKVSAAAFGKIVSGAIAVVALAVAITSLVFLIKEQYAYYHPTYTPIPKLMLDLKETDGKYKYIKYQVVNGQDDNPGDLNGFVGIRWNALYTTKEPSAGKPILASAVTADDNTTIKEKELKGVHDFGSTVPTNLNNFVFNSDAKAVYLYFTQDLKYLSSTGTVFANTMSPLIAGMGGMMLGVAGSLIVIKGKKKKQTIDSQISIG